MSPLRVLHVDKDRPFLEITQRILDLLGDIKVDIAQTVNEANLALSQNSYDAIISAYYLGSLNGLEYYNQLRAKGIHIPFILFTVNEESSIEAQRADVSSVTKFGDPEKVFSKLTEIIKAGKQ